MDFCYVFRNSCWFWATKAFSVIGVCTTAFKFIIPVDDCWVPLCRVPITFIKPLLCFNSIFPMKKLCLINTRNSFLSIVLKMTKVASPKPLYLAGADTRLETSSSSSSDCREILTLNGGNPCKNFKKSIFFANSNRLKKISFWRLRRTIIWTWDCRLIGK